MAGKAFRAFGWAFFGTFMAKFGRFGIGVLIARLLGPHEFGVYAVAFVALTGLVTFNELGVAVAVVRWEGDVRRVAPTSATISVVFSVVLYGACYLAAPAYATLMGAPARRASSGRCAWWS